MWPFTSRKRSSEESYTQLYLRTLESALSGGTADPTAVSAVEVAAGLWARSLAMARVTPPSAAALITPGVLAHVGRQLIRAGEALYVIDLDGDKLILVPASTWSVEGGYRPSTWRFEVTLPGPSGSEVVRRPNEGVVWVPWAVDAARPHKGISPLTFAASTGRLLAGLDRNLADEAGMPTTHVVPIPTNPKKDTEDEGEDDDQLAQLGSDLVKGRGSTVFVETTAAGWDEGSAAAPKTDWVVRRLGANVPDTSVRLRNDIEMCVLLACGIPTGISGAHVDGSAAKEALRRWLHVGVAPVGRLIAEELSRKLETEVNLDFRDLFASDVAARARSFHILRQSRITAAAAAEVVGLDNIPGITEEAPPLDGPRGAPNGE